MCCRVTTLNKNLSKPPKTGDRRWITSFESVSAFAQTNTRNLYPTAHFLRDEKILVS
ncbi:hypothetical protein BDZ89DRAFT_1064263 [Hymenopellis radicata]|nr:hypothetical protein BDZ89DRAFT_1064263 [Hymenopellis radicata]